MWGSSWLGGTGDICLGVARQDSQYKPSCQGSYHTKALHLLGGSALSEVVLWNGICLPTFYLGWVRPTLNIQMKCSATFLATYGLGRKDKGKPSCWLVRKEWRDSAMSGLRLWYPLIISSHLTLLRDVFIWVWSHFLSLSGQKHSRHINTLSVNHAALTKLLILVSKTHV